MIFIKQWIMVLFLSLSIVAPSLAKDSKPVKYGVGFKSYNTRCHIYVNGLKALSNIKRKGPVMAGVTMSAYLENGINAVAFDMAPFPESENTNYQKDAFCELTVSKTILYDESEERTVLFKLIGKVDEDFQPTGKQSPNYEDNQVIEHPVDGTDFYRVSKSFEMNGLPEWTWTKATSFEPTEENMQKLREAYLEIWQAINTRNEKSFKELSYISFSEKKKAAYYPGGWYDSLGFDKDFEKSVGAIPINWGVYELVVLNKGRLVKLEDNKGFSPLGFRNKDDKRISTYSPYFSLIDGKIVLTR